MLDVLNWHRSWDEGDFGVADEDLEAVVEETRSVESDDAVDVSSSELVRNDPVVFHQGRGAVNPRPMRPFACGILWAPPGSRPGAAMPIMPFKSSVLA